MVYEIEDVDTSARLALKTLARFDAASLYRFKKELRVFADLHHPSLVRVHELVSEGAHWFFTMDLVDGVDWMTYVRGGDLPASSAFDDTIDALDAPVPSTRPNSRRGVLTPLAGGTPMTISSTECYPIALTIDDSNIYWANATLAPDVPFQGCNGNLVQVAKSGGAPMTIATGDSTGGIVSDGSNVYWTIFGDIVKVPVGGGLMTTLTATAYAQGIAIDGISLY
jgi:hypothetical protein